MASFYYKGLQVELLGSTLMNGVDRQPVLSNVLGLAPDEECRISYDSMGPGEKGSGLSAGSV